MRTIEDDRIGRLFATILSPMGRSVCHELGDGDLPALKDLALENNVLPLLYTQLLNGPAKETGPVRKFLDDVRSYFLKSAAFSMRQEALEKEALSLLRKEGVRAIVIKGNAIARDVYEDRNCRLSEDVDILVRQSDVFRASAVLSDAGYSGETDVPLEYRFVSIHHATFYKAHETIPLEVHWLFGVPSFFGLTSAGIWDEVLTDSEGNYKLSPELQLVLLLVHHHSHSFRELKTLIDILWTMWRYEAVIDRRPFVLRLERTGLIRTAQITLDQIRRLWNHVPGAFAPAEALAGEIEKRGHRAPTFFLSYFSMDITGNGRERSSIDKIVKRFALDRPSAVIRSFRALLPSARAVSARYGERRLWRLPFNYSRYIIWQLKCWKG